MSVVDIELADCDPFGPEWRQDPWPIYRRLRKEAPVLRRTSGSWLLTRFADCSDVLKDRRFGSDPARLSDSGLAAIGANEIYREGGNTMLFMDPPDHTRLRSLVSKAFTPRVVAGLRTWMERIVDRTIDDHVETGRMELISDLAHPLPVEVICQLLGVPDVDRVGFRAWSSAASRLLDGNLTPELEAEGIEGSLALFSYFSELVDERRATTAAPDDLLSRLVDVEEAGDRLTSDELLTMVVLLFVAGHETTTNLIGNGVLALLDHPEQLRRLTDDPALAARAVEESLRYAGPIQLAPRVALEDVPIGDDTIRCGDAVICAVAAANRDPRRYSEPDRYRLDRSESPHLAFSHGPHHCLGAALARLETEVVLSAVVRRLRNLDLAGDRPVWRAHAIVRGLEALPVGFTPGAPVSDG
jgi:pimeloyl-[acyl-carrier protein] synthase